MSKLIGGKEKTQIATLFVLANEDEAEKIWSIDTRGIAQGFKTIEEMNVDDSSRFRRDYHRAQVSVQAA